MLQVPTRHVIFVQDYVPGYRVKFFDELYLSLKSKGTLMDVAVGRAASNQLKRGDSDRKKRLWKSQIRQVSLGIKSKNIRLRFIPIPRTVSTLIIYEHAIRNLDVLFMLWAGRRLNKNVKIALWGHGENFTQKRNALSSKILLWMLRRCDHYFVYTPNGEKALMSKGLPSEKISCVYNSLDTSGISESELSLKCHDVKVVTYIGGIDAPKGSHLIPAVANMLGTFFPEVRFEILGTGTDFEKVKSRISELNLRNTTFWGYQDGAAKHRLLSESNLLIQPGRVGLSAVESLAYAAPIVTRVNQLHGPEFEYIKNFELVFELPEDEASFLQGLQKLILNPGQIWLKARKSNSLRDKFTLQNMVGEFELGILKVLDSE